MEDHGFQFSLTATRDIYKKSISKFAVSIAMLVKVVKKIIIELLLHPYTWTAKRQLSVSATTTQETHLITNTSARPATLP